MRQLHPGRDAVHHDPFMAPVEPKRLTGGKIKGNEGLRDATIALTAPALRMAPDGVMPTLAALATRIIENPRQPVSVPLRALLVRLQHRIKLRDEGAELRHRRVRPFVAERRRLTGPHNLANRVPAEPALPADLLDALTMNKVVPPDLSCRLQ